MSLKSRRSSTMIQWQYYPKSDNPPDILLEIVDVFHKHELTVNSLRLVRIDCARATITFEAIFCLSYKQHK